MGLAVNSAGDLFVASYLGTITEINPAGVQSTFASGLSEPFGLACDSAGDLFVGDWGSGMIYKFTPGGTESTFASGLDGPTALAFQPVPEPSALGLLAVGVTAMLVCRRRRCATTRVRQH
jgi:streptogramin lyase